MQNNTIYTMIFGFSVIESLWKN